MSLIERETEGLHWPTTVQWTSPHNYRTRTHKPSTCTSKCLPLQLPPLSMHATVLASPLDQLIEFFQVGASDTCALHYHHLWVKNCKKYSNLHSNINIQSSQGRERWVCNLKWKSKRVHQDYFTFMLLFEVFTKKISTSSTYWYVNATRRSCSTIACTCTL